MTPSSFAAAAAAAASAAVASPPWASLLREASPLLLALVALSWAVRNGWHLRYQARLFLESWFQRVPLLDVPFPPVPTPPPASPSSSSSLPPPSPLPSPLGKSRGGSGIGAGGLLPTVAFPSLLDPTRPGMLQCWNPASGQYLGQVPAMGAAQVEEAVRRAARAQEGWKRTTFAQRRRVLRTIQRFLVGHVDEVCLASSLDSGKPPVDAVLGEVLTTCEKVSALCRWGEAWLRPEERPTSLLTLHKRAAVEYVPLGVIATIAPWNYPFHNMINHVLSGIFAGNAVVGKVSEHTSWSSYYYYAPLIRAALAANGHDPDLCQLVTGLGDAGHALCSSPLVAKIIFTGSPEIGSKVMATASKSLKPVVLELGGKDAFCVLDDADLSRVVPFAMRGCFQNGGQNCVGIERVLCYESVHDAFVDQVHARIRALRTGPPPPCRPPSPGSEKGAAARGSVVVDCGALVMKEQLHKIQELVDDAVVGGAKVLCGGSLPASEEGGGGQFYPPTLLVGVTPSMKIFHTEVFGPVMSVTKVPRDSDDACADLANATTFGLGSSVFTSSASRGLALGRRIRSGMVCVNDFGSNYLAQSLPFGGVGESGFGRFAGVEGLRALCLERAVLTDRFPLVKTSIPPALDYPIKENSYGFAASLIAFLYSESLAGKVRGVFGLIKFG